MQRRVFRKGAANQRLQAAAVGVWIAAAVVFLLLSLPEIMPAALWSFLGVEGSPSPSSAERLLGMFLGLVIAGAGLLLWRGAPYLGGTRIVVDEQGIECNDRETWLRASWGQVQGVNVEGDVAAARRYTLATSNGSFSFAGWQIDNCEDLIELIQHRIDGRK